MTFGVIAERPARLPTGERSTRVVAGPEGHRSGPEVTLGFITVRRRSEPTSRAGPRGPVPHGFRCFGQRARTAEKGQQADHVDAVVPPVSTCRPPSGGLPAAGACDRLGVGAAGDRAPLGVGERAGDGYAASRRTSKRLASRATESLGFRGRAGVVTTRELGTVGGDSARRRPARRPTRVRRPTRHRPLTARLWSDHNRAVTGGRRRRTRDSRRTGRRRHGGSGCRCGRRGRSPARAGRASSPVDDGAASRHRW